MKKPQVTAFLRSRANRAMDRFRRRLAHADALPQLALMGVASGLVTGVVAILFRLAVELPLQKSLPGRASEAFETLEPSLRFALPLVGALLLAGLHSLFHPEHHRVGVSHVIERYQLHQGRFSARNMILQFLGGALALITGHSGGREGPAVHLGAASSSLMGQWLQLPNNSLRVIVGCGIAAAIAASFNTPLAGVVFAMEVVMMEYRVIGFLPVIIAAVIGSILSRAALGNDPGFTIPELGDLSLWALPWMALSGIAIGLVASLILVIHKRLMRLQDSSHWLRFLAVGLLTGAIGCFIPEVLGIGYDTLQAALLGEIALSWLGVIIVAKVVLFTVTFGLGVPVGGIAPTFFLGACLGGAAGILVGQLAPIHAADAGFYATLGMGGMMAATLNAPLAALIAILELTHNPDVLMPGMLVIVTATLTTRMITRLPGLFLIGYNPARYTSPVLQMLNRTGVTSRMTTNLVQHSRHLPFAKARKLLAKEPRWIVIGNLDETRYLLNPADLARYLQEQDTALWEPDHPIDLHEIPAERHQLYPIHPGATLQEAWVLMKRENVQALYVTRLAPPLMSDVAGVLTREDIENFYMI